MLCVGGFSHAHASNGPYTLFTKKYLIGYRYVSVYSPVVKDIHVSFLNILFYESSIGLFNLKKEFSTQHVP
jgi:hypothetical protein